MYIHAYIQALAHLFLATKPDATDKTDIHACMHTYIHTYIHAYIQALAHPFFATKPDATDKTDIARRVQDYLAAKTKAAAEKLAARETDGMQRFCCYVM